MGKTIACDICGKTPEQILATGALSAHIHRFKRYSYFLNKIRELNQYNYSDEFYICDRCLFEIEKKVKKESGEEIGATKKGDK